MIEIECFENMKALFKTDRPLAPVNEVSAVEFDKVVNDMTRVTCTVISKSK